MSKPLKTVEEWFEAYMPKGTVKPNKKIDAEKAELMTLIMANWRKRAKADLYQLMLSLVEDFTHYHRTCQNCGKNWWGLHCPHDGYQNPCPECKSMPVVVNQHYCDCDFVIPVDELKAKLSEHFNGEGGV